VAWITTRAGFCLYTYERAGQRKTRPSRWFYLYYSAPPLPFRSVISTQLPCGVLPATAVDHPAVGHTTFGLLPSESYMHRPTNTGKPYALKESMRKELQTGREGKQSKASATKAQDRRSRLGRACYEPRYRGRDGQDKPVQEASCDRSVTPGF